MSRKKSYIVDLHEADRRLLEAFVKSGHKNAREITRARILLLTAQGMSDQQIMALLNVSRPTVGAMRKKYAQRAARSVLSLLTDAPRSGRSIKIDSTVEANLTLLACSAPPEGAVRWTLTMIADRLVALHVIETISSESVRRILKKVA